MLRTNGEWHFKKKCCYITITLATITLLGCSTEPKTNESSRFTAMEKQTEICSRAVTTLCGGGYIDITKIGVGAKLTLAKSIKDGSNAADASVQFTHELAGIIEHEMGKQLSDADIKSIHACVKNSLANDIACAKLWDTAK